MKKTIKYYRYPHPNNVGDTLTPYILQHFIPDAELKQVKETEAGKVISVGSIMRVIKSGDTVLGSGVMRGTDKFPMANQVRFLAVRGAWSRDILIESGGNVPKVYGDPALLLPLMYKPEIERTHTVGLIPHYIDRRELTPAVARKLAKGDDYRIIDVFDEWQSFVDQVLACDRIVSSSLHGLIIAEAYGKPVEWVELSNRVIGNGFKFKDYLTGTGRKPQNPGEFPLLDAAVLADTQKGLIKALQML